MIAVVLSVLIPGLGQIYLGKTLRGILMVVLAITPLYPAILVWSVLDCLHLINQGATPQFARRDAIGAIVLLGVVLPMALFASWYTAFRLLDWYQQNHARPRRTVAEASEIVRALGAFHYDETRYPAELDAIIRGRPLRKGWNTDEWGRPYLYELEDDAQSFRLLSPGRDGIAGTQDDLVFTPETTNLWDDANP
jgi:hypothetical protein